MSAPVSVLMSTFNRAAYIGVAIESLLNQSVPPAEILVMNDGCSDQTNLILRKFQPRITLFNQENQGKSVALNFLSKFATQEFIWIFDDDDIALPNAIEAHFQAFSQGSWIDFTYSPCTRFRLTSNNTIEYLSDLPFIAGNKSNIFPDLLKSCVVLQPGMLVRSTAFKETLPYRVDLARSLDYEFLLRLVRCRKGAAVQTPTFLMRVHEGPRGRANNTFSADQRFFRWYKADQSIFSELYGSLDTTEYVSFNGVNQQCADRSHEHSGLLARAVVMGRKGLWSLAIEDLERLSLHFQDPLIKNKLIEAALDDMFSHRLALLDLITSISNTRSLRRLIESIGGSPAVISCGRRIFHCYPAEIRSGDYIRACAYILGAFSFLGIRQVMSLLLSRRPW